MPFLYPAIFALQKKFGHVITYSLNAYTLGFERLGTSGSVNFNLKYVPFNLTVSESDPNPWTAYASKSNFNLEGLKTPEWIIRNGINDLPQDAKTDFNAFHHFVGAEENPIAEANGNGAVSFVIAAEGRGPEDPEDPNDPYPPYKPGDPEPPAGSLVIKDGIFEGLL